MDAHFDVFKQVWVYAISFVAAIVSYRSVFEWSDTWQRTLIKFLAHLVTCFFSAVVAHELVRSLGASQGWTFVVVSLMSWQGSKGLELMSNKVNEWIGAGKRGK